MRSYKWILFVLAGIFNYKTIAAQNALINIGTQHSGIVRKDDRLFLEVSVNNTDPVSFIGTYKIRAQITVPSAIATIDTAGHVLPTGWAITSNDGTTISISNGTDMMAATVGRTLLIALRGKDTGGPSTIIGQLVFSDGNFPGTAPGALKDDIAADNSSTTTVTVVK